MFKIQIKILTSNGILFVNLRQFITFFLLGFQILCFAQQRGANTILPKLGGYKIPLINLHEGNNPHVELVGQFIDDANPINKIGFVNVVIYEDTSKEAKKSKKQFEYPTKDKSLVEFERLKSNKDGAINFTLPSNRIFIVAINRTSYYRSFFTITTFFNNTAKHKSEEYQFYYTLHKCEPNKMELDTSGIYRSVVFDFTEKKFTIINKTTGAKSNQLKKDSLKLNNINRLLAKENKSDIEQTKSAKRQIEIDEKGNSFERIGLDTINRLDANDKKQGKWRYSNKWFTIDDKNLQPNYIQGEYINDKMEGNWNKYYDNDSIEIQFNSQNNALTGDFKLFWPNGKLKSFGNWIPKTDKFAGPLKLFDETGSLDKELEFDSIGTLNGNQIIYYPNGLMAVLARTKNGLFDGQNIVFTEQGKVMIQRFYENGKLITEQNFAGASEKFSEVNVKKMLLNDQANLAERLNKASSEIDTIKLKYTQIIYERNEALDKAGLIIERQKNAIIEKQKQLSQMQLLNQLQNQKIKVQKLIVYGSSLLLILLFLILFLLWKRKKEDNAKHALLQELYFKIETQHNEIIDSIEYAERIQFAILPTKENIAKAFPQSFILFKPKDIVSGDFYWFQEVDGKKYIAACDCTGHGVPGALMSMVATDMLNEALVHTKKVDEILAHTNRSIRLALKQSTDDDSTRDGMDIALCCFNDKTNMLQYSGAYRPLWLIRHAEQDSASSAIAPNVDSQLSLKIGAVGKIAAQSRNDAWGLIEYKATKAAIGGLTEDNQTFQLNEIQLQKGDTIYLASDGFADQFSPADKKLMTKRFKEILLSIQHLSMPEQGNYLDKFITDWRGNMEQTDDVLVIGVRV
jgi:serine phosphatase RsbU (regulator of sigma subunit)/antitoxin component YwqK of YwqJK toxin-antitoxin module